MNMYTDPNRLHTTNPGKIENNPLWIFHDAFNPDKNWVEEAKVRYRKGQIGDVECKKRLIDALLEFLNPIRQRRSDYARDIIQVNKILSDGAIQANDLANETLRFVQKVTRQQFQF